MPEAGSAAPSPGRGTAVAAAASGETGSDRSAVTASDGGQGRQAAAIQPRAGAPDHPAAVEGAAPAAPPEDPAAPAAPLAGGRPAEERGATGPLAPPPQDDATMASALPAVARRAGAGATMPAGGVPPVPVAGGAPESASPPLAAAAGSGAAASGFAGAGEASGTSPFGSAVPEQRPAPPARQVAPAVIALGLKAGGAEGSGAARIELLLEPAELGRVQVHVEPGGGAGETITVRIFAERPETLALLQRDARELDRALTQAGLGGADGRGPGGGCTLSFALGDGTRQGFGANGGEREGTPSGARRDLAPAAVRVGASATAGPPSRAGATLALLDIAV
jgi:hypothetical protein